MNYFAIPKTLPTLNEVVNSERTNRYKAASERKKTEQMIAVFISLAVKQGTLRPVKEPCEVIIEHYEKYKRKDADNLEIRAKFILDGLVQCGILENDSRKYVKNVYHTVHEADIDSVKVRLVKSVELNVVELEGGDDRKT